MKVAVYYPWVYLTSGVERTILEIVKRSKHTYTIFTNHLDKENTYREFKNFEVVELSRVPVERSIPSVLSAATVIATQKIDLKDYDVLLVHCDGLGDLILTRNSQIPSVCFCHTPLRPVFDKYYRKRALKKRPAINRLPFPLFSYLFKKLDQRLWRKYRYVFFNSKETLRRAKKGGLLATSKGRFEVLYPGVDLKEIKPSWVYKPYFLLAGRIMWTKNIELAIEAFIKFKKLSKQFKSFRLVIAGQVDEKSKSYLAYLKKVSKGRKDIEFVISPKEKKLKKLNSECWAVLLPSFNEDWGMTALEGNAFGKPVIATNRGGPKESQIDGETGFLVKPIVKDFSEKMATLAGDEKLTRKLGKKARKNARLYDWSYFIMRLDSVLEEIVRSKKR